MRPLLVLLLALPFGATAACNKKSDAPDCKAAASTYATLVKEQIDRDHEATKDETRKAQALSLIPSLKEEMAKACEKNHWSEGTRACIKNAKAASDLPHCMPKKPEKSESAPEGAPEGAPATPGQPPSPESGEQQPETGG